jgi:hypothetical protein
MSAVETDIQWYIARDGKQHGPVSDRELRKLVELSHLKATDLVWRQGFSDWRTAVSVFPEIERPAPAPAPAASPAATAAAATPAAQAVAAPNQASTPAGSASASAPSQAAQPAPAQTLSPQPYAPQSLGPVGDARRGPGDFRPEPITGRPAGSPLRTEGPFTGPGPAGLAVGPGPAGIGPGPRVTTDSRKPSEMVAGPRPGMAAPGAPQGAPHEPEEAPRSGRRKALVVLGLLAMTAAGAWISSQHKDEILEFLATQNGGIVDPEVVTANAAPPAAPSPPPATNTPAAAAPTAVTAEDVDRRLQRRTTWVSLKQEFPDWYQARVAEVARLSAENKEQAEITRYLVNEYVQLRRENAKYALAASTVRHKEVASAFLANLKLLSQESGEGCYDFISRGEISPSIMARLDDPAKSAEIEAQMVAIVAAIAEGKKQPSEHSPPIKTDYDVLAGELGRLGWTQADMQLFANPRELAKAPRERVCNMLKDWFTAHLSIQDPSTQERLLFETLKPVVSG